MTGRLHRGHHPDAARVLGRHHITVLQRNGVVVGEGAHQPLAHLVVITVHPDERHALRREMLHHEIPDGVLVEIWHARPRRE